MRDIRPAFLRRRCGVSYVPHIGVTCSVHFQRYYLRLYRRTPERLVRYEEKRFVEIRKDKRKMGEIMRSSRMRSYDTSSFQNYDERLINVINPS